MERQINGKWIFKWINALFVQVMEAETGNEKHASNQWRARFPRVQFQHHKEHRQLRPNSFPAVASILEQT